MTTDELKQKIIDKAAEILEDVETSEELKEISEVYGALTNEDWTKLMIEKLSEKANEAQMKPWAPFEFSPKAAN